MLVPGRVPISAATLVSSSCLSAPPALNRPLSVPQRTCTDTSSLPTRSPRHAAIAARPHEFTVSCVPRSRIYTRIRFCLKALEKLAKSYAASPALWTKTLRSLHCKPVLALVRKSCPEPPSSGVGTPSNTTQHFFRQLFLQLTGAQSLVRGIPARNMFKTLLIRSPTVTEPGAKVQVALASCHLRAANVSQSLASQHTTNIDQQHRREFALRHRNSLRVRLTF